MKINTYLLLAILALVAWAVFKPVKVVAENANGSEPLSITTTVVSEIMKAFTKKVNPVVPKTTTTVTENRDYYTEAVSKWKS